MAFPVLRLLQKEAAGFFSDFEVYTAEDRAEAARIGYHKVLRFQPTALTDEGCRTAPAFIASTPEVN